MCTFDKYVNAHKSLNGGGWNAQEAIWENLIICVWTLCVVCSLSFTLFWDGKMNELLRYRNQIAFARSAHTIFHGEANASLLADGWPLYVFKCTHCNWHIAISSSLFGERFRRVQLHAGGSKSHRREQCWVLKIAIPSCSWEKKIQILLVESRWSSLPHCRYHRCSLAERN